MWFGTVPLSEAEGTILAHSMRLAGGDDGAQGEGGAGRLAKGRCLTAADLEALAAAGETEVTVARLGPGDLGEDAAAAALAAALVPEPAAAGLALTAPHAGRVNLKALGPGIVMLDAGAIHRLNRVHPALTLATLPPFARVAAGTLVGTVKVIAYAAPAASVAEAGAAAAGALAVRPVQRADAGLVMTTVPGQAAALNAKGRRAVERRLQALGMRLAGVETVPHETGAIAAALGRAPGQMLLILTGSATSDLADDAPEALRRAGGQVARFGMPVDPGNLLFHGTLGTRPVIGLPGCARSPALNGADWVLERLACGLAISDDDIAAMGVGGLLKEIPIRPQPREARQADATAR